MYNYIGRIVEAVAGRDKGGLFCVVGIDQERSMLLLADGKRRKMACPKAKKVSHIRFLTQEQTSLEHPAIQGLKQGTPLSDRALRRALAAFKEGITLGER